ncbi:hypothetical protein POX_a01696 [Penicillium oxalicum]|uniref:Uncharacterized protein n=1 Tax=Penicillium oxalicum (strain 114-2 / CGMCC 5302) TaxID=933388 RepID=S8BE56_PENO1|nr:hypothetical protein POX_a01696 [Penicillium oxalicum]EPS33317.1 hypothetical protein PDE_08279 [Penicillium oxalicum 114-2]KAI2795092.1 hypothetical protein POX_a01696 [Penicillium oxalicum]
MTTVEGKQGLASNPGLTSDFTRRLQHCWPIATRGCGSNGRPFPSSAFIINLQPTFDQTQPNRGLSFPSGRHVFFATMSKSSASDVHLASGAVSDLELSLISDA